MRKELAKKKSTIEVGREERLLYPKKEAAYQLGISVRSLNYLLSKGKIRFRRVGGRVLIPRGELVNFARGHHPEPIAGPVQVNEIR